MSGEKVIGYYYTGGGQQRVDVSGPDDTGSYCAWNLHRECKVAWPLTLTEANAHIRERGGVVYS